MKPSAPTEIAQSLVRIPSVNPTYDPNSKAEIAVQDWIEDWGREYGFQTEAQPVLDSRSNITLKLRNGADHPHVLFNGHTDTVGVGRMTIDPFGGEIRNGRLWGRGTTDMKGSVACMMAAAVRLRDQANKWKGTVSIAAVVDEEYRFRGISKLMEDLRPPEYAVVGEPTLMRVVRGCKGTLRFTVSAQGRACHSSNPQLGRSAIIAMAEAVLELNRFFEEHLAVVRHPAFGTSTLSVGVIEGGAGINIVPENCRIQVDVRLLPGRDARKTYQEIQRHLLARVNMVKDIRWTFEEPSLIDSGYEMATDSELVRQACAVVDRAESEVAFYSCDASKIALKNIPTIIMGPGDIAQAHTADESIGIDELDEGASAFEKLALTLMPVG